MFILPFITSFLSRASGSAYTPRWFPATAFSALIILACSQPQSISQAIIYALFAYAFLQTGHGNFWLMKGIDPNKDQPEKIEEAIRPITTLLKLQPTTPLYSWLCMGIKGFGIALPLGLIPAAIFAALHPLAYHINFRTLNRAESPLAEILSGAALGIVATLFFG